MQGILDRFPASLASGLGTPTRLIPLAKLVSDEICPQKMTYMQQEFSLLRFFYQVKEVVLLIVGARMDRDPSPS